MFFKKYLILATALIFSSISAEIIESSSIASVTQHVTDQKTLVVFDIDNTIMEANEIRATDQWFSAMVTYAQNNGYQGLDAVNAVLPFYEAAQKATTVKAVEAIVSTVISNFQQNGNTVIALTSRSLPFLECTPQQFASLNIDLTKSPLCTKNITLAIKHPAQFHKGILFCSNNDKGEALQALLKELAFTPNKIVFIDDKEKYLLSVQKITLSMNVPFVGIRYSFLDAKVAAFVLDEESKKLIQPKNPITQQQTPLISYSLTHEESAG